MFEQQMKRLRFHINDYFMIRRYKKQHRKEEQINPFEQLTEEQKRELLRTLFSDESDDLNENMGFDIGDRSISLEFDPNTAIVFSGEQGRRCNFLNAWYYRRKIRKIALAQLNNGTITFFADYMEPFGLLALETLCELRKEGQIFSLYALQSGSIAKRRSYRLIPEINVELIFLGSYYDEVFSIFKGENILLDAYALSKFICNEGGIHLNENFNDLN